MYDTAYIMKCNGLNIVFLGNFPYPYGMAGTKRVQHAIDALKIYENISIRVITQRGSTKENKACGVENGIPYHIIMPDIFHIKALLRLPWLWMKTLGVLKEALVKGKTNIIYKYASPGIDDAVPVCLARRMGWKVVYDIVEDDSAAANISTSFYHKFNNMVTRWLTKNISFLADGLIIISSHLGKKYKDIVKDKLPVILRPISIDLNKFPKRPFLMRDQVSLFYAGSFGVKDGVENLILAFEQLAGKYDNIFLVFSGKGSDERMNLILQKIASSKVRKRIDYKGYLTEAEYFELLNNIDVPCMTRIDSLYANAGFPFKLGEFLATGKPVIASRLSDVESYLTDQKNALLVAPGSVDEIVKAVEYLLNNKEKATQIGQQGRVCAKTNFDYSIFGEKLLVFLQSLSVSTGSN